MPETKTAAAETPPPGGWPNFVADLRDHVALSQTQFAETLADDLRAVLGPVIADGLGVRPLRQATVSDWEGGKQEPAGLSVVALRATARRSGFPYDGRRTRLAAWVGE